MGKISDAFPTKYLSAQDLNEEDEVVTIESSAMEDVGQGEDKETKLVLKFEGAKKGLVLNKTNAQVLITMFGDDEDELIGKRISLWINHDVQYGSKTVSAIRIRAKQPK